MRVIYEYSIWMFLILNLCIFAQSFIDFVVSVNIRLFLIQCLSLTRCSAILLRLVLAICVDQTGPKSLA